MGGWNKGKGAKAQWLRDHASYSAKDDCLIWPFSRSRGYGMFGFNGQLLYAHRYMCELVKGPASTPNHEAAHSCGRGEDGCVHPKHLSWKTRTGNERDKIAHGRSAWGPRRSRRYMLTSAQVLAIRASDKTVTELAEQYHVTRSNIRKILKFETWPNLPATDDNVSFLGSQR